MSFPSRLRVLATFLLAAHAAPVDVAAQARDTLDVLFIGNSYIYFNNLPDQLEAVSLALAEGPVLRSEQHVHGGAALRDHLQDGHLPGVLGRSAAEGAWDRVVLQEQSTLGVAYADDDAGTLGDPGPFHTAARAVVANVRSQGAEPIFYMTWAKEAFPGQIHALAGAYEVIGGELGVPVAPAGRAWHRVRRERPDLELFTPDGSHPSPTGSYLVACVMYATLTGASPAGAPGTLRGIAMSGSGAPASRSPVELVSLDPQTAAYLQRVAWETVLDGRR